MKLPTEFVEEGLALAARATIFGVPFADLSRDEAVAAAALGWMAERKSCEQAREQMNFVLEMDFAGMNR
jgi:hypothetical protein